MINADQSARWADDIAASVDLMNQWFKVEAPKVFKAERVKTAASVKAAMEHSADLSNLTPALLKKSPGILPALRMACCPPIARDRLTGLSGASKNLVKKMEEGEIPKRMKADVLLADLGKIAATITEMLDRDLFPWLAGAKRPSDDERRYASAIVAERLCGAQADPIIRNAHEVRQQLIIGDYLKARGYLLQSHPTSKPITDMPAGTYAFRMNVVTGTDDRKINIPMDVVVQPKKLRPSKLPIFIEAKAAGDFTNVNKRRKEEAKKASQLFKTYGDSVEFILFLCGYFDKKYLEYEKDDGMDWIWEHRPGDLDKLGL